MLEDTCWKKPIILANNVVSIKITSIPDYQFYNYTTKMATVTIIQRIILKYYVLIAIV